MNNIYESEHNNLKKKKSVKVGIDWHARVYIEGEE
jgi:hypothetical protein